MRPPSSPDARPLTAIACSTVFGIGFAPIAPGTWGSVAGLALWFVLPSSTVWRAGIIVFTFALGIWSASAVARHFRSSDPSQVVIDEVLGMFVTLFLNPVGWRGALAGLLLFRALDILKPFPARRFEQLHGGLGVMADDAMAGLYANALLRGLVLISA